MASFTKVKGKKFKLRKDAEAWANKEKKKLKGSSIKKEINFLPRAPKEQQWEALILRKSS